MEERNIMIDFKQWLLERYKPSDDQYGEIVRRISQDDKFPVIGKNNDCGSSSDKYKLLHYIVDVYGYRDEILRSCGNLYNIEYLGKEASHKSEKQPISSRLSKGEASKQLKCATKMPPLIHKAGDGAVKFDITKSEVAQWLLQQPDIMQYAFTRIKN